MKTIVMTGGTAGIGLAAAKQLRSRQGVRLLLGARDTTSVEGDSRPLDLTRLDSVRSFAAAVQEWLAGSSIDALVLNAGTQFVDVNQRTEDGFETTFAVNHLAHYLLLRLLMPRLATGAIVVITTSNLHDPRTNPIAAPQHADVERLARGQTLLTARSRDARAAIRAYAASKLCNLLTACHLAASDTAQKQGLRVIAFNPGLTPGTQLARRHSAALKFLFTVIAPALRPIMRINTPEGGGSLLADLALGKIVAPAGRIYASQVKRRLTWPDPSELAGDEAVINKLWADSATLVRLPKPH
jgi:NAD(P)-dependent dehydrogenase (short-subunit alcohol dehydrogenase family)